MLEQLRPVVTANRMISLEQERKFGKNGHPATCTVSHISLGQREFPLVRLDIVLCYKPLGLLIFLSGSK